MPVALSPYRVKFGKFHRKEKGIQCIYRRGDIVEVGRHTAKQFAHQLESVDTAPTPLPLEVKKKTSVETLKSETSTAKEKEVVEPTPKSKAKAEKSEAKES